MPQENVPYFFVNDTGEFLIFAAEVHMLKLANKANGVWLRIIQGVLV